MVSLRLPLSMLALGLTLVVAAHASATDPRSGLYLAAAFTARLAAVTLAVTLGIGAWHRRWPSRFSRLLRRHRRALGLSFATVHLLHLGVLVTLGLRYPATFLPEVSALQVIFGGLAYLVIIAMAATSNDRAVRTMGRHWRRLHLFGGWYLSLLFIRSYALRVLGGKWSFLPLLVMFVAVVLLRLSVIPLRPKAPPQAVA